MLTAEDLSAGVTAHVPLAPLQHDAVELQPRLLERWKEIESALKSGNLYADKKDFSRAYEDWKAAAQPTEQALARAAEAVRKWMGRQAGEPGLAWRVHDLLAAIALDRRDVEAAALSLDEALSAYPDRKYSDPAKQSKFQHIVNDRAMLIWDSRDAQAALDWTAELLAKDRRFRFFFAAPWEQRLGDEEAALAAQMQTAVRAAYVRRAATFPEFAPECARFGEQLVIQARRSATDSSDETTDVPAQEVLIAANPKQRYFLIGPLSAPSTSDEKLGLVVILPGGDGSAEFLPFVKRICKLALGETYVAAQPVAVEWTPGQSDRVVWPTKHSPAERMEFTTEAFVDAVIADVETRIKLDRRRIFTLSWSSGGPAAYSIALRAKTPIAGSFIAMSVFKPEHLPPLSEAAGRAFYLYHAREDPVCPFRFAEEAERKLKAKGGVVELKATTGGHEWQGDVFGEIRTGIAWLEERGKARR